MKRFIKVACLGGSAIALLLIIPLLAHQNVVRSREDAPSGLSASPLPRRFDGGPGRMLEVHGAPPVGFEPNHGQADERVRFLSRNRNYTLFLTDSEVVLFFGGDHSAPANPYAKGEPDIARIKFVNANPAPSIVGVDALPGKSNYFIGNDAKRWRTDIPQYQRVQYRAIYPGIDVIFYRNHRQQLEFDFVVAPGADPKAIRMAFEEGQRPTADSSGAVLLRSGTSQVKLEKPVISQMESGARKPIDGGYKISSEGHARFELAAYNPKKSLVIDPVLDYSTYIGGRGADRGEAIAVDAFGHIYVAGWTASLDFPTTSGAFQPARQRRFQDAFVAKIDATNSSLVYSTYLGGALKDWGLGIAVDAGNNAYITGETFSRDFPVTFGAFQTSLGGDVDIFVTKLDAAGSSLVYSTYIGGNCLRSTFTTTESAAGIQVDSFGNAYIAGSSSCRNFPTTMEAFQPQYGGGRKDAVVAKLNSSGDTLLYSSYLGGRSDEYGTAVAVDTAGNAYVTGTTHSLDFPTTGAAFQPERAGSFDGFVTKVDPTGSSLIYSTYLGGRRSVKKIFGDATSAFNWAEAIAVDGGGRAYVTGYTDAANFPTTAGSFQPNYGGGSTDAFVTKLDPQGSSLIYSTYLGGSRGTGSSKEAGQGIAADSNDNAYITGRTSAFNFPTTANSFQPLYGRGEDAFIVKLDPSGSPVYSSYLGGSGRDEARALAVDGSGSAYVTGFTTSKDFPTQNALQPARNGATEAFMAKIID